MTQDDEDTEQFRDAQAAVAGAAIAAAFEAGTVTFGDYPPEQIDEILADLPVPDDDEEGSVPLSVRLPRRFYRELRAYAAQRNTTASALMRQWAEQNVAAPDRLIHLGDVMRVLATLPGASDRNAA